MRFIALVFWLIILLLAILFVSINSQFIVVHYYFGLMRVYFPLLFLILLFSGVFIAWLIFLPAWLKAKTRQRRLNNTVKDLQQEVNNLRNIPIKDNH